MPAAVETAVFRREPAWHGLGKVVEDAGTTAEAIRLAGLDWTVDKAPLYAQVDAGSGLQSIKIQDKMAVIRNTDQKYLGIVGDGYKPIQNASAFAWFDKLARGTDLVYESAGSLYGGRVIWILARLPEIFSVKKGDDLVPYTLLFSSHDGSKACSMTLTSVRVVCANTLEIAEKGSVNKTIRIMHTRSAEHVLEQSAVIMGELLQRVGDQVEVFKMMSQKQLSVADVKKLNMQLFPAKEDGTFSTQAMNSMNRVTNLFEGRAMGAELAGRTAWGYYNAVSEYVEHVRPALSRTQSANREKALQSNWFGQSANLRKKAFGLVTS